MTDEETERDDLASLLDEMLAASRGGYGWGRRARSIAARPT